MQITSKTDSYVNQFNHLKSDLSSGSSNTKNDFNKLLNSTINTKHAVSSESSGSKPSAEPKLGTTIPSWVDLDYSYDPQNPRKPNMRELMEAISGRNVEDLYSENKKDWQKINHLASEMLYGVVGSREDTRDWISIMSSDDILEKARMETAMLYDPQVDIVSAKDDNGVTIEQVAIIKDKEGTPLRELSNNISLSEEMLKNFGATKASIPKNLDELINPNVFDKNLLVFLQSFDQKFLTLETLFEKPASENQQA